MLFEVSLWLIPCESCACAPRFEDAYVDDMFDERRELREAGGHFRAHGRSIGEVGSRWIQGIPQEFHESPSIPSTDQMINVIQCRKAVSRDCQHNAP